LDLGPEGGEEGGYLIGAGTPEEIAAEPESATGRFLAGLVEPKAKKRRAAGRKRVAAAA
jgi:excinuclease ABC subunit A